MSQQQILDLATLPANSRTRSLAAKLLQIIHLVELIKKDASYYHKCDGLTSLIFTSPDIRFYSKAYRKAVKKKHDEFKKSLSHIPAWQIIEIGTRTAVYRFTVPAGTPLEVVILNLIKK